MRPFRTFVRRTAGALALVCLLGVVSTARPDGGEDGAATDDLLSVFRPFYAGSGGNKWTKQSMDVPWSDWWYANRRALFDPPRRLPRTGSETPNRDDAAARKRARDALRPLLDAKEPFVCSEAALALGRSGDASEIEALAAIVESPDLAGRRRLHRYAAVALGMLPIGDEQQAERARTALVGAIVGSRGGTHQFSFFWSYCAYALAMRGDPAAIPDLVAIREKGLRAANASSSIYIEVLGAVCYALGSLGGELSLPEIEEHLSGRKAPDCGANDTSWSATQALARVGGDRSKELLLEAAADERWPVRAGAMQALGIVSGADDDVAAKTLAEALEDDRQTEVRRMAAIGLGRMGHKSSRDALLRAFRRGSSEVRPFVAIGLGLLSRHGKDAAIESAVLEALKESRSDEAQGSSSLACAFAGLQDARPLLAEVVESGGPTAAPMAAFALGILGADDDQRKALHEAVDASGKPLLRREAALALARLGDASVVDQLRSIVTSRASDRERGTAAVCLGRIGDDDEIDVLVSVLQDRKTSDQLRACVAHALGWLLDRDDFGRLARVTADVKWDKSIRGVSLSWSGEAMWDLQHLVD